MKNAANYMNLRSEPTHPLAGCSATVTIDITYSQPQKELIDEETKFSLYCVLPEKVKVNGPASYGGSTPLSDLPSGLITQTWTGELKNNKGEFENKLSNKDYEWKKQDFDKWKKDTADGYGNLMLAEWCASDKLVGLRDLGATEVPFTASLTFPTDEILDFSITETLQAQFYLVSEVDNEIIAVDYYYCSLNVIPQPPTVKSIYREYGLLSECGPLELQGNIKQVQLSIELEKKYKSSVMSVEVSNTANNKKLHLQMKKKGAKEVASSVYLLQLDTDMLEENSENNVRFTLTPTINPPHQSNYSAKTFDVKEIKGAEYVFDTRALTVPGKVNVKVKPENGHGNSVMLNVADFTLPSQIKNIIDDKTLLISTDNSASWKKITKSKDCTGITDLSQKIYISYCDKNGKRVFTNKTVAVMDVKSILKLKVSSIDGNDGPVSMEPDPTLIRQLNVSIQSSVILPPLKKVKVKFPQNLIATQAESIINNVRTELNLEDLCVQFPVEKPHKECSVSAYFYANLAKLLAAESSGGTFAVEITDDYIVPLTLDVDSNTDITLIPRYRFACLPAEGANIPEQTYNIDSFSDAIVPSLLDMAMTNPHYPYEEIFKHNIKLNVTTKLIDAKSKQAVYTNHLTEKDKLGADQTFSLPALIEKNHTAFLNNRKYQLLVTCAFKKGETVVGQPGDDINSAVFNICNDKPAIVANPVRVSSDGNSLMLRAANLTAPDKTHFERVQILWTTDEVNDISNVTGNILNSNLAKLTNQVIQLDKLHGLLNPRMEVVDSNGREAVDYLSIAGFQKIIDCHLTLMGKDGTNPYTIINPTDSRTIVDVKNILQTEERITLKLAIEHKHQKAVFQQLHVVMVRPQNGTISDFKLSSKNNKYKAQKPISSMNNIVLFNGDDQSGSDELTITFKWTMQEVGEPAAFSIQLVDGSHFSERMKPVIATPSDMKFILTKR